MSTASPLAGRCLGISVIHLTKMCSQSEPVYLGKYKQKLANGSRHSTERRTHQDKNFFKKIGVLNKMRNF